MGTPLPDAAVLLRTEHAVVRVLATARDEAGAWPRLLAAIGRGLDWDGAALWTAGEPPVRAAAWGRRAPAGGLPARVLATGGIAWTGDALAVPVPGVGALELWTAAGHAAQAELLATVSDLGLQLGQFAERCRAVAAVRAGDARKTAILDAAFDCIVTMDHAGRVLEVNAAAEQTFGYAAEEMIGRELAALIVPPALRPLHRAGLERYVATGVTHVRVARENGRARVEVADDGVGGAVQGAGSGLRGLADRVEALGGRLELDSPAGAGTRLRAEIPCG